MRVFRGVLESIRNYNPQKPTEIGSDGFRRDFRGVSGAFQDVFRSILGVSGTFHGVSGAFVMVSDVFSRVSGMFSDVSEEY